MGGYGAVAAMMGGMMASMMMAALAALAGKAMMTSLLALMMAAFAAMKGGGGGGGSKTYEVITKPVVSHIDTHSSEVQHEHHGHYHKRSLDLGGRAQEQESFKQENVAEHSEVRNDHHRKGPELNEAEYGKESATNQEYYAIGSSKLTGENREKSSFEEPEKYQQKRNTDLNGSVQYSGVHTTSEIQNSNKDFDRFKRELENTVPDRATPFLPQALKYSGGPSAPLLGHPRQNHKEYRRNTDDDLLMSFGLFR